MFMWRKHKKNQSASCFECNMPRSELIVPQTDIIAPAFPVIDTHVHFGARYFAEIFEERYNVDTVISQFKAAGVNHVINLEIFSRKHWNRTRSILSNHLDYVSLCAPIDVSCFTEPDFSVWIEKEMRTYAAQGACGFKIWKNLGLNVRDSSGVLVRLTDVRLKTIWNTASELGLPIVIHIGDPPAFFKPMDKTNERLFELQTFPGWSYHSRTDISFYDILKQQEALIENYPETVFIAAHMGALATDLSCLAEILNRNKNLFVDCAAVLAELGRQPRSFLQLIQAHSDRILFGTDTFAGEILQHRMYYRFFETYDEYFPYRTDSTYPHGLWNIYGCRLSPSLLQDLYYKNAAKVFRLAHKA